MEHQELIDRGYRILDQSAHFVLISRDPGDALDLEDLETLEGLGYRFMRVGMTMARLGDNAASPVYLLRKPA